MYIDLNGYFGKLHSSDQQIIRAVLAPYSELGIDFVHFIMNFNKAMLSQYSTYYIDRISEIVFSQKESSFIKNAKYVKDEDLLGRDEFLMRDPDVQRLHDKFRYLRMSLQDFKDLKNKLELELDLLFSIDNMKQYVQDSQRINLIRNYLKETNPLEDFEDAQIRLLFIKNINNINNIKINYQNFSIEEIENLNNKDLLSKMDLKLLKFDQYFFTTSLSN